MVADYQGGRDQGGMSRDYSLGSLSDQIGGFIAARRLVQVLLDNVLRLVPAISQETSASVTAGVCPRVGR
jgi:hypothetical protein